MPFSEIEQSKINNRPNAVDYDRLSGLHYVGNYVRRLPTNMTRMIENAYDWEHLPYVHESSFASIDLIAGGDWGWRARIGLPGGDPDAYQLLDLLVDAPNNYWVSTVFHGPGEGIEIHTQASTVSEDEIEVDVRFYLPEAPADSATNDAVLAYMTAQYTTLYDEDIDLMQGRQTALEDRLRWRKGSASDNTIVVGRADELDRGKTHVIETETGRYCVRWWQDSWHVHSAVCPHLLGPLEESEVDDQGRLTCPWHGYQFDLATGTNVTGDCSALADAPALAVRDGVLVLLGK